MSPEVGYDDMFKSAMFLLRAVILIGLAFGLSTLVQGQGPAAPQTKNVRPDPVQREVQRQFEMQLLEQALTERRSQPVKRYAPLVLEQIRLDFLRLQIVDRKVTKAAKMPGGLDLDLVTKSAAEIRKRSARLKKNLALPDPETAPADRSGVVFEAGLERLRTALSDLSNRIEEFVSNPMFEQIRLVDPQLSGKARRDIEAIIELSGQIKRSSEKLKMSAKTR